MKLEINKEELLKKLLYSSGEEFKQIVEETHPADILDVLHENEDKFSNILDL